MLESNFELILLVLRIFISLLLGMVFLLIGLLSHRILMNTKVVDAIIDKGNTAAGISLFSFIVAITLLCISALVDFPSGSEGYEKELTLLTFVTKVLYFSLSASFYFLFYLVLFWLGRITIYFILRLKPTQHILMERNEAFAWKEFGVNLFLAFIIGFWRLYN